MQDTLLGVPVGKPFDSQIRPHIVGPDLRVELFATKTIFLQNITRYLQSLEYFLQQTNIFNMAEILPSMQWVKTWLTIKMDHCGYLELHVHTLGYRCIWITVLVP